MGITSVNSPEQWQRLKTLWEREAKPAYLTAGSIQYQVIQNAESQEFEFIPVADTGMIASSSMSGVSK